MVKYEDLMEEYEDLLIEERPGMVMEGLYADGCIWIKRDMTSAKKAAVLAEEIGHHETSGGDILDQSVLVNSIQERKARAWAHRKLIPIDDILRAFSAQYSQPHEIAEFLDVDEEFLKDCLEYYGMI